MSPTAARIFTLGPAGTFSDQAAQRLRAHLGAGPIAYTRTIPEVVAQTVADLAALGVIPIENSDNGTIGQAQDSLVKHAVTILWEIAVTVRFSVVARGPLERVATFYAHPQAHDQCSEYVGAHLPGAQVLFTNSNMESGLKFLDAGPEPPTAAIVPVEFGEAHPELLVAADIQNYKNNTTRFLAVQAGRGEEPPDFARGKTSLLVEPDEDRPGLLFELLEIFNRYRINLCRLESRPDKIKPWNYLFFIDFNNNSRSAACVADLQRTRNRITVLGSYDLLP